MHITATFSNGETDVYKGHRPVKAAWRIVDHETGKTIVSGHSLDRDRAERTATNKLRSEIIGSPFPYLPSRRDISLALYNNFSSRESKIEFAKHWLTKARDAGLMNDVPAGKLVPNFKIAIQRMQDANAKARDAEMKNYTIEIVDL